MATLSQQLKRLQAPQTSALKGSLQRSSLLFDRSDARGHDTETVFALGTHGFKELLKIDEEFAEFQSTLFNESSTDIERSVLTKQENEKLQRTIRKFLFRLAPYLLLTAAHQALEWLIFKFQINRYDADDLLKCALCHHDSSIFVKLLQISFVSNYEQSPWYWLSSVRKNGVALTRQQLLNHCVSNMNFLQLICELAENAREALGDSGRSMQLFYSFYVSIVCGTLDACGKVTDNLVGRLMPYIGDGLKSKDSDFIISSCMIICQLATKVVLAKPVCEALLAQSLLAIAVDDTATTIIPTAAVLCQTQPIEQIPSKSVKKIVKRFNKINAWEMFGKFAEQYDLDKLVVVLLNNFVDKIDSLSDSTNDDKVQLFVTAIQKIVDTVSLSAGVAVPILRRMFTICNAHQDDDKRLKLEAEFESVAVSLGNRLRQISITDSSSQKPDEPTSMKKRQKRKDHAETIDPVVPLPEEQPVSVELEFTDVTKDYFVRLSPQKQRKKFEDLLVEMRSTEQGRAISAKEALLRVEAQGMIIADVLRNALSISNVGSPTKKKRRLSDKNITQTDSEEPLDGESMTKIRSILEIFLANVSAKGGPSLVSLLFTILKRCLKSDRDDSISYLMQICMASLVEICKGPEAKNIKAVDFDIDTLVNCIRSTEIPRIQQHAFQLLSVAAKLFKEDLVIRLMPIFSFMGKGLLRQDNSYTFEVIRRTIENVIPPLLTASNNSVGTTVTIFRDFVMSVPHIPEHRRLVLLTKLVTSAAKCELDENTKKRFTGGEIARVENFHLWILIGLMLEYHVMHWKKPAANEQQSSKDPIHPAMDFIIRISSEFSPADQLYCLIILLSYVDQLPDEAGVKARHPNTYPSIFELTARTDKQLRHFKYETVVFAYHMLSSSGFVGKLVDLSDRAEMPQDIIELIERLIEVLLTTFDRVPVQKLSNDGEDSGTRYWQMFSQRAKACLDKINDLLPAAVSLSVISGILERDSVTMKRHALDQLSAKLLQNPTPFTKNHVDQLISLTKVLTGWIVIGPRGQDEIVVGQCALYTLKLLVRVLSNFDKEVFQQTLIRTVDVISNWRSCNRLYLSNAILCLAELVQCLGPSTISHLPRFAKDIVEMLNDEDLWTENDIVLVSSLTAVQRILEKLNQFFGPYLSNMLTVLSKIATHGNSIGGQFKTQVQHRISSIRKIISATPSRVILPAVEQAMASLFHAPQFLSYIFLLLNDHIKQCSSNDIGPFLSKLTSLFLESLNFRCRCVETFSSEIDKVEDECMNAFSTLALKISENNFRPIMFKLVDWASRDKDYPDRLITLFRLTSRLYDTFRGLFNLFAGQIVKLAAEVLKDSQEKNLLLNSNVLDTIRKCCEYDSHGFITRERFDMLMTPLVEQLDECSAKRGRKPLLKHISPCIAFAAVAVKDDAAWKVMNYQILLKTRNTDPEVRLAALKVLEELYGKIGSEVSGLVAETVPFLAELLEDENEEVEQQCEKVITSLENVLGDIKQYF